MAWGQRWARRTDDVRIRHRKGFLLCRLLITLHIGLIERLVAFSLLFELAQLSLCIVRCDRNALLMLQIISQYLTARRRDLIVISVALRHTAELLKEKPAIFSHRILKNDHRGVGGVELSFLQVTKAFGGVEIF